MRNSIQRFLDMQWTSNSNGSLHSLDDENVCIARIHVGDNAGRKNRFKVKVLISFLYFGKAEQRRLERSSKEWKSLTRKFDTESGARTYVQKKKSEILGFIRQRENS